MNDENLKKKEIGMKKIKYLYQVLFNAIKKVVFCQVRLYCVVGFSGNYNELWFCSFFCFLFLSYLLILILKFNGRWDWLAVNDKQQDLLILPSNKCSLPLLKWCLKCCWHIDSQGHHQRFSWFLCMWKCVVSK